MKALVTGCAGFIDSHITERLLRDGFDAIGILDSGEIIAPLRERYVRNC